MKSTPEQNRTEAKAENYVWYQNPLRETYENFSNQEKIKPFEGLRLTTYTLAMIAAGFISENPQKVDELVKEHLQDYNVESLEAAKDNYVTDVYQTLRKLLDRGNEGEITSDPYNRGFYHDNSITGKTEWLGHYGHILQDDTAVFQNKDKTLVAQKIPDWTAKNELRIDYSGDKGGCMAHLEQDNITVFTPPNVDQYTCKYAEDLLRKLSMEANIMLTNLYSKEANETLEEVNRKREEHLKDIFSE